MWSIAIILLFGIVAYFNNPFEPKGLTKLRVSIGSIATGYAVQAACFAIFNIIALIGDKVVRDKLDSSAGSFLVAPHFFAGIFMMFALIGTVVGAFENGYYLPGTVATAANAGVWVYVFKTNR